MQTCSALLDALHGTSLVAPEARIEETLRRRRGNRSSHAGRGVHTGGDAYLAHPPRHRYEPFSLMVYEAIGGVPLPFEPVELIPDAEDTARMHCTHRQAGPAPST